MRQLVHLSRPSRKFHLHCFLESSLSSRRHCARNTAIKHFNASCRAVREEQQHIDGQEFFASDARSIILYDGVCNLCNGGVRFMLEWDAQGAFRFAALQSPAGRALLQRSGRDSRDISSIVLVEENGSFVKSEAILRIARGLDVPFPFMAGLASLVPLDIRDWAYDQVADNRYGMLGKTSECRLSDSRFEERFLK